jgi:hypothetical protein
MIVRVRACACVWVDLMLDYDIGAWLDKSFYR